MKHLLKPRIKLCLFAACYIFLLLMMANPLPVVSSQLNDSDDYLRMVRVVDLLDNVEREPFTQPRLGPADNEDAVAWSSLIDHVLALGVSTLEPFLGRMKAALTVATFYPFLLLLGFLFALYWAIRQGFEDKQAWWGPVLVAVPTVMAVQFAPGRVDHHSLQIILITLMAGCLLRLYRQEKDRKAAAFAGILAGFSWSISAETLPWVGLLAATLGLFWLFDSKRAPAFRRTGLVFGAVFTLSVIAFLPLTSPFASYSRFECDAISLTHIIFAASVFLFWAGVTALPARLISSFRARLIGGGLWAGLLGLVVIYFNKDCLLNPYALSDPSLYTLWLDQVNDPKPLLTYLRETAPFPPYPLVGLIGPNLLAFFVCSIACLFARREKPGDVLLWGSLALLMAASLILIFWAIRTALLGQVLALIPLSWLMLQIENSLCGLRLKDPKRLGWALLPFALSLLCLIGLVMFTYSSATENAADRPYNTPSVAGQNCNIQEASEVLNQYPPQKIIAANAFYGAELLWRTPHRVLAATYQRNQEGILAAHRLLATSDEATARHIADQYGINLILTCEELLPFWQKTGGPDSLAVRLQNGQNIPLWLDKVAEGKDYKIHQVSKR